MSGCVRKHLCYCTDCGKELARRLRGRVIRDCVVSKAGPMKISRVKKTPSKCLVCGDDGPTCSVLHGSTYNHRNTYSLLLKLVSRKCTCYCQVCAFKEFAKVLTEKCKHKCPVCQREADRIVVKDDADDERVRALRRCKSAVTVREKLEGEFFDMHRVVVPVQREPSNQTVSEDGYIMQRVLLVFRYAETLSAKKKLVDALSDYHGGDNVPSQQRPSLQIIAKRKQNTQRRSALHRCMEALFAGMKLVDALSDYCKAETTSQQGPSNQTVAEGIQNLLTYSMPRACDEAMSASQKAAEESSGSCDNEIPDHQESTNRTVAEGKQSMWWGVLPKCRRKEITAALDKLDKVIAAYSTVKSPIRKAPSDHTVVEDASTLRKVPLLIRCDSATFSWDKQCPICQTTPDVDQESKCVFFCLTSCFLHSNIAVTGICAIASRDITRRLSGS